MALSIAGVTFADLIVMAYDSPNKYWHHSPAPSLPDEGLRDRPAEGVEGVGVTKAGHRNRIIGPLQVLYVAASANACQTEFEADRDTIKAANLAGFEVVYPHGSTYQHCYCPPEGFKPMDEVPRETETGNYYMRVAGSFMQKRPND
jgi:hypothetical protein